MQSESTLTGQMLAAQGLEGIETEIAPEDDMYNWPIAHDLLRELGGVEYIRSGYEALCVVKNALRSVGRTLATEQRMLEFASGYGRLTRLLVREMDPARIDVADILAPAVAFSRERFGVNGFVSAADAAELELDQRYSVIFVGSLFSHLPRHRFAPMLKRLYDALLPNGLLMFSTHRPSLLKLDVDFVFQEESESDVLSKSEYGATYASPAAVADFAEAAGVAHLCSLERELWWCQDLYIASPEQHPGLSTWTHAPVARGKIAKIKVTAEHVWVGGFVRLPRTASGLARIELLLDGEVSFDAIVAPYETPMEDAVPGELFVQRDWYLEGSSAGLAGRSHSIAARAYFADGACTVFDLIVI